ncbi:hypothetical protein F5B22DRAFT_583799 [Xylaria bambusicola]|uniref:uncharacterized protein n=1 Tax=Xylaria bambusicola TaxID=326684 RepID=UPI0020084397|nr:uncharacterized protein F5B22DRAFT_583799 [Xylaria bambusicola]KAI0528132.1 hypothetical protein F5B22DRAFT_583799 [Xylaria bambusicola]
MSVFPIWTGKWGAQFAKLKSSRMSWYIADALYIPDCFEWKVLLLALYVNHSVEVSRRPLILRRHNDALK